MGSFVRLEVKERIAYLSLERPKAYNALSRQVVDELDEALEEIASCGSISVLVIRSRKNFASGADIREMADLTQAEAEKFSFSPTFDKLAEIPIPTVAAIEGYALGGGLELALACDLRIASEDAVLGLPEITLGIMPGAGGTVRLPRIIGEAKAKELIYMGEKITAREAGNIGLVNSVVSPDSFEEAVETLAGKLSARSGSALRAAKRSIDGSLQEPDRRRASGNERQNWSALFGTYDQRRGCTHLSKRGDRSLKPEKVKGAEEMRSVVITAACRTPIGAFGGAFKNLGALDLTIPVMQELIKRSRLDAGRIDDVIWGCNYQKTYRENNLARVAAVKAGLPVTVPGITVHRNCTSSVSSVQLGFYQILAGEADFILAGGTEVMSNAPHTVEGVRWEKKLGNFEIRDSMWDSLTNLGIGPAMGITAENLAERYQISRKEQDELALLSQQRACRAVDEGKFKEETVPIEVKSRKKTVLVERDEYPRKDASLEALSKLSASFKEDGTVTAGNASGMNDASSGVILASEEKARELGLPILARIISTATVGVEPDIMGIGPVDAVNKALKKAGLSLEDMERVEINEAFAAQYLACEKALNLNREITNVNGSGISLGHPVGATGTRIITSMIYELLRERKRYGLVAICAGGGMGTAMVLEALQKEDQEERSHV
ncbi:MAG: acetyl-CoA C-acyltransferase [[Clostridium] symbiosum]